ncbi:MAG: nickel pincer cofactor biosynthesis protein LarC [Kiritimatiellae bacterium]|nr:nickel pincer cofactor biosynthesis protein LarC [Kiritimatiellia bacterium]
MKHLHFDSVGGASGDMILAVLLDLGVSREDLQRQLAGLPIGPFEVISALISDRGLHGTQVTVQATSPEHTHAGKAHSHAAAHPPHRGLKEIRVLIEGSQLSPGVKAASLRVFQRLAEAEAQVHGTTPDEVRFHEVGAVDAIVDIAGACLGLEMLGVADVSVGPLPMGYGTVACAHGVLPVPAPATVELLKGLPVTPADEPFELVTPTGAALLATWKTMETFPSGSRILKVGQGFGSRKLNGRPNVLRAMLMESESIAAAAYASPATDACLVLECNLDDLTPELTGALLNRLLGAGALDVFLTPVQMKKQRPGILLTVLCRTEQREAMLDMIFRESTTFGIREYPVRRTLLERRHESVETPFGPVRVKIGRWQGADITLAPEYDDCLKAAGRAGVSVRAVYDAALGKNVRSNPRANL